MIGHQRSGVGRKPLPLDPATAVGGFVIRNGLSRGSAATILGCTGNAITKWGCGRTAAPLPIRRLIAALEKLAAAGLPWPGDLQPDPRPEPRFPPLYPAQRDMHL